MSTRRHTASTITDDALDALYENASRGWRRGDRWKKRALQAEAGLKRVRALASRWAVTELRATLDDHQE